MRQTILVVEDDHLTADLICTSLQRAFGAEVVRCEGNRDAIEFLSSQIPALVITDLFHSGGRGEDLVAHIRSTERLRAVPIIVQSGQLFGEGFDPRLFEHRVDAAFRKPWTMSTMLNAVTRCLRDRDAELIGDVALILVGIENKSLDYKRMIDLDDKKQRACLAKDVIAFSNSGGGSIVVGVSEESPGRFVRVGLVEAQLQRFEATRLNDALRRYIGTELSVSSRRVELEGTHFVIISVPACAGSLSYAREEHPEAGLYPGRIYVRNDAAQSVEVRDAVTLNALLDRVLAERDRDRGPT